jgi:hypothetical protein
MNHTQMRIAIAQSLGWTDVAHGVGPNRDLVLGNEPMRNSSGKIYGYSVDRQPPDYPGDLNACHQMEKYLTKPELWQMTTELAYVVPASTPLAHATASQRCEAYLRVKGLIP